MSLLAGPLMLIAARARRRPTRWLLTALGVAVAVAFAGAVAAEGTIAGDEGARSVLAGLSPLDRAVRVTWQGFATPMVGREARAVLDGLGLRRQTEVVLLAGVRLGGRVVQPAAIEPLARGVSSGRLGPCRASACPVLIVGGGPVPRRLAAAGVVLTVVSRARLLSAAPLGFLPAASGDEGPLLVSGDVAGLDRLAGLGGVFRTHGWVAELSTAGLQSWQLAALERRLQRAQAEVSASSGQFSMAAPFAPLDAARAQARAAPRRLLLAGGGALAVLAAFVVLAAGALRRDQRPEVERLRRAGATTGQCAAFVLGEAAWLCAAGVLAGACLAVLVTVLLATAAGVPVGGVLVHSLITPAGAAALVGGWACATILVGLVLVVPGRAAADATAVAAVAALVLALIRRGSPGDSLALLLAPLCCVAAGVITFRVAESVLRGAERVARHGAVTGRLALVSLARAPAAPALAIAFVAVSIGLGAFALAYRSTLLRGSADQAANEVPLDAVVSPAADFTTPLEAAPLARWRRLAEGRVLPVRTTDASFASGAATTTVPVLGVPAVALTLMHGWRASDGSAPLPVLARRLTPPGPVRVAGPSLPPGTRYLALRASAPAIAVAVTADLRDSSGRIRQVSLGSAGARPRRLVARVPPGRWELEALELDEPTGLAITTGHQNGENPAASTQFSTTVRLGPLSMLAASGATRLSVPIGRWRGVGAAASVEGRRGAGAAAAIGSGAGAAVVRFAASGQPGVIRPAQPSDTRPVPVLVDPQTATTATRSGLIAMTVDEVPVSARVVGVLRRFPTIPAGTSGFVIADQATLDSALDAQLPGQGRPDQLWISSARLGRLRAALRSAPLSPLGAAFRGEIEERLRSAPIARGVLGTLVAATLVSGALAALALLTSLLGPARDPRFERDLEDQGVGPGGLRRELRLRLLIASVIGVCAGLLFGILLTRLAVAAVAPAGARPPLITVAPWAQLAGWGLVAVGALALVSLLATRWVFARGRAA